MTAADTIAAIATPPGYGAVGIVRLSGPDAARIGEAVAGSLPEAGCAALRRLRDELGETLDEGLVLRFAAPASSTGEDVVELQGHGGPVVMDRLLSRVLALGARQARPGEFSQRAFVNGKLDLTRAEAVADLIASSSQAAARAAARSLAGAFAREIDALVEALTRLRVEVEAAIDFSDEDIDTPANTERQLDTLEERFAALDRRIRQGSLLREGLTVAIVGPPNAGKSSLLNQLASRETAIVTEEPGTTRDVLREPIALDGMPLNVVDTAGLREAETAAEREGVRRAEAEIEAADRVLLVRDDRDAETGAEELLPEVARSGEAPVTRIRNKIDLSGGSAGVRSADPVELGISALSGAGLDELAAHLREVAGYQGPGGDVFSARRRHLDALARAREHLRAGRARLTEHGAGDLLAEELRLAQRALGEITGAVTSEDLLDRIFADFCIGK